MPPATAKQHTTFADIIAFKLLSLCNCLSFSFTFAFVKTSSIAQPNRNRHDNKVTAASKLLSERNISGNCHVHCGPMSHFNMLIFPKNEARLPPALNVLYYASFRLLQVWYGRFLYAYLINMALDIKVPRYELNIFKSS